LWQEKNHHRSLQNISVEEFGNYNMTDKNYKYDIVLSFAGEDRKYVKEVADCLKANGVNVFYDEFEEDKLWGKDLYVYLDNIYRQEAKICIMFLSKHYAKKLWTNHERESAQARAFQQNEEYIHPIKLDDTEIPGIKPTTGYLDGRKKAPREICDLTLKKLNSQKLVKKISDNGNNDDEDQIPIPKIRRTISDLEKKKFLKSSFNEIKNYFDTALNKLNKTNQHIETDFDEITSSKFVATVYVEGQIKSQCKIWIGGMWGGENSISYAEGIRGIDINNDSSMNDSARVTDDGIEIYFDILGMSFGHLEGIDKINLKHASAKDVAIYYWTRFTNYLRH
jgi:predicted MPP superfamily phosphohydrolase